MNPFEILVRENAEMLTVYLRCILRDEAAVDDIFQETMLVAWQKLSEFDSDRAFGPWLRGIAGRLVLAHRRKSARAPLLCDEIVLERLCDAFSQIQQQPGDTFDQRLTALRECLGELPDASRSAIELRYEKKFSRVEMAQQLAVTTEVVKKRLQRARARLLACLQGKLATGGAP